MNTKLTLSLDKHIIEEVKNYAKKNRTSLSKMVENYFRYLTTQTKEKAKTTELVKELTGIINLPKDFNEK